MNTAATPQATPCPQCREPVISTPERLLDAEPTNLGIHHPDGIPMTKAEVVRAWRSDRPLGRHTHVCPRTPATRRRPEPQAQAQPALFPLDSDRSQP